MNKMLLFLALGLLMMIAIAACTDGDPTIAEDDIQVDSDAAQAFDFETNVDGFDNGPFGDSSIELTDGSYQISSFSETSNHYLIGQNHNLDLQNVAIEVTISPQVGNENNWYGVVCRTDEDDTGYALLISSDGFWSIAAITQSGNRQFLDYLVQWREDGNINQDAANTITAYCIDDYLALYVNGEFLGEHEDGSIDRSGGVGFLAGGETNDRVVVNFDDATISPAQRNN